MGTDARTDRAERAKEILEEARYAAVGLGDVAVDAARSLGSASHHLPEKLREAPEAIASVAGRVAVGVRRGFDELTERGREVAGDDGADGGDASDDERAAADDARSSAADVQERTAAAATSAASSAASSAKADVGTGSLEDRTVAQLRERAAELGILGRTTMRKHELVDAIRARQ